MFRRSPPAALILYTGRSHSLTRWSADRRTLYTFGPEQPVRVTGGPPFQCASCGHIYDAKPERCEQVVEIPLKLLFPDGHTEDSIVEGGARRRILGTQPCGSAEFATDLDLNEYRRLARENPADWRIEEA